MGLLSRLTPEQERLVQALGILTLAYVAVHWRYFFFAFPHAVFALVDPRKQTLMPQTNWGFIVRALLVYGAYKLLQRLQAALHRASTERHHRRVAAVAPGPQAAAAEQFQASTSQAASVAAEAKRLQEEAAARLAASEGAKTAQSSSVRGAGRAVAEAEKQTASSRAAAGAAEASRLTAAAAEQAAAAAERPAAENAQLAERKRAWLDQLQAQQDAAAAAKAAAAKAAAAAEAAAAAKAAAAADAAAAAAPSTSSAAAAGAAARSSSSGAVAAAASGAASGGAGASTASSLPRPTSSASMIPLAEAREAEERQRQWLQQLSTSNLSPLQQEAMEAERKLKAEQDADYEKALAEDRRRAEEKAAAEAAAAEAEAAAAAAAEATARRFEELRQKLRAELPAEPDRSDETAVLVRVRLPDGCNHTRRFAAEAPVSQVRHWLQSLDEFPTWEPTGWSLVSSYPRQVIGHSDGEGAETPRVADVAGSAKQVALFVQQSADS